MAKITAGYKPCIISTIVDLCQLFPERVGYKPCIISTIVDHPSHLLIREMAISLV